MSVLAKGMDMAVAWYVGSCSTDPRIEVSNRYLEAHVQHGYIYLMNNVRVHLGALTRLIRILVPAKRPHLSVRILQGCLHGSMSRRHAAQSGTASQR
jgi:hypothetical protein